MNSFLQRYLEFTQHNEAPEIFHFWAGMAVVGHALNRQVWLDRHYFKVYPGQLMVVLVADSATSKKTTAINLAVDLLNFLPEERTNILPMEFSTRTLMESLNRVDADGNQLDAIGFIAADELGTLLSKEAHAEPLVTLITGLNTAKDGPYRRAFAVSNVEINNPCLGGLMGTTPEGLANELPKAAHKAGFFGRLITIYSDESAKEEPLIEKPPQMDHQQRWLVQELYRISEMRGEFHYSEAGKAWMREWYHEYKQKKIASDQMTGYYGRKDTHLLRCAMIFAAAQGDGMVLTPQLLESAARALSTVEHWMPEAHRQINVSRESVEQDAILAALTEKGGPRQELGHTELLNIVYRKVPRFRERIDQLVEAGLVERVLSEPRGQGKKPRTLYRRLMDSAEMLYAKVAIQRSAVRAMAVGNAEAFDGGGEDFDGLDS